MRALFSDTRGEMTSNLLGFSLTWLVTFSVFLMNVQLGQLFHRRDVVDHAAAVAADTARKTYCEKRENKAATERAALDAVRAVLDTAGDGECALSVDARGAEGAFGADPGARALEVSLRCVYPCKVPVAAAAMCTGGRAAFSAKISTVATGCDGEGG